MVVASSLCSDFSGVLGVGIQIEGLDSEGSFSGVLDGLRELRVERRRVRGNLQDIYLDCNLLYWWNIQLSVFRAPDIFVISRQFNLSPSDFEPLAIGLHKLCTSTS